MQRNITHVTNRAQQVRVAPRTGTWLWVLQRLTAYGLLLFLGIHIYFTYFARLGDPDPLTFSAVDRPFNVYAFGYALNEFLLLFCALFHGLNGLRNIIYDWTTHTGLRTFFSGLLLVVGIVFAVLGVAILWTFISTTV